MNDRTTYPLNINLAEERIRADVDAWHAGHMRKGHAGMFYAALDEGAPIFYTGPVYCAQCRAGAMPPQRTPWHSR